MNVDEVATALGITPSAVRNQLEKGAMVGRKADGRWSIATEAVETYRRERLGNRARPLLHTPESKARRAAALTRPETRAKMRSAGLGQVRTPEHRARISAALSRRVVKDSTREKHRQRQLGVPKSPEHRAAIKAAAQHKAPVTAATGAKISAAIVQQYLDGRRPYSRYDVAAAAILLPLGFVRFPSIDGHAFDFGSADGSTVVEVNGCGIHRHRLEKPTCRWKPYGRPDVNVRYRAIAQDHGLRLIELWACEQVDWPTLVHR